MESLLSEQDLLGISPTWLPFAGFWLLLILFAAAELAWPLYRKPKETPGRLVANFGLGIVNALLLAALPVSAVLAAEWARQRQFGLSYWLDLPLWAEVTSTLVAWSFASYWLHRAEHRIPLLWRMHQVHHADTAVDLSTGVRHHPGEALVVAVLMSGLAALLGLSAVAIAAYALVAGGFALWTHLNLSLPEPADRLVRLLFTTPAAHHVHHSSERDETDSNYADVLILWDRLCGTYCAPSHERLLATRFGLGDAHDPGAGSLLAQLRAPVDPALRPRPARSSTRLLADR